MKHAAFIALLIVCNIVAADDDVVTVMDEYVSRMECVTKTVESGVAELEDISVRLSAENEKLVAAIKTISLVLELSSPTVVSDSTAAIRVATSEIKIINDSIILESKNCGDLSGADRKLMLSSIVINNRKLANKKLAEFELALELLHIAWYSHSIVSAKLKYESMFGKSLVEIFDRKKRDNKGA